MPEWIQAFGVVIASIGLIYTLLLQRKTLIEQQIITSIERNKYINSYLPILELTIGEYQKINQDRALDFTISIRENFLQKLEITNKFANDFKIEIPRIIPNIILPKNFVLKFNIKYTLSSPWIDIEEYSGDTIIFHFEDAFGNKYSQLLIYKGANNIFLHPATKEQI